jgi:uncharacterized protein (TIGR00251 family)
MSWYRWEGDDLILRLRIQPRANRDGFVGVVGNCLKVRITAAPVEGEANVRLIRFLAQQFGTSKANVALLQGHKGKIKVLRIQAPAKTPTGLEIQPPSECS